MSIRQTARFVLKCLAVLGLGYTLSGPTAWTQAQELPPGTLYSRPSDPAPPPPSDPRPQEPSPTPPGPYLPAYLAVPPGGPAPAQPPASSAADLVPGAPWDRVTREPRKVS